VDGVASDAGAEDVGQVGEERASLEAAGDRGGEQSFDRSLALLGIDAKREFAVDDGAAEAAFGVVVGRLDPVGVGEGPERGPAVEEILGKGAVVLGARAFPRCVFEQRAELCLQRRRLGLEAGPVAVLLVGAPGVEEVVCDLEAVAAETLLFAHALAVGGEVSEQVGPAELPAAGIEVVVAAPAVGADDAGEPLAEQDP